MISFFARELRRHCRKRGSIAEVCRGTGINRQQFNKYLAGRMLPGSINMRKICSFLAVSEAELMSGRNSQGSGVTKSSSRRHENRANDCQDPWSSLDESAMPVPRHAGPIPNGFYEFYLPYHGACHMLLRWLLQVSESGRGQVFSCRAVIADPDQKGWARDRFSYRGLVVPGPQDLLLIGMGALRMHQPSVISVSLMEQEGRWHFPALALTRRASGPLATLAGLHYRGSGLVARQALARTGVVSIFDPGLDPVIAAMMSSAPQGGWNWMQSALVQHARETAMPAGSPLPASGTW